MKLVREHITRFERSSSEEDFKRNLNVGKIALIKKWFKDLYYEEDDYTINDDLSIIFHEYLDLSNNPNITLIPDNLKVELTLDLANSYNIISLPSNLYIGGTLFINNTNITSLPEDLEMGKNGTIFLGKNSKVKYIPDHLKKHIS